MHLILQSVCRWVEWIIAIKKKFDIWSLKRKQQIFGYSWYIIQEECSFIYEVKAIE